MFTNEEAQALIEVEKHLVHPKQPIAMELGKQRIDLYAPTEPDYTFFIEVNAHSQIAFKMTLHAQEKHSNIGLLRIDFKGSHTNPSHVLETLPDFLKPYAGHAFRREGHIHFYVEGYPPLDWAMPLTHHAFAIKELKNDSDYIDALFNFAKMLHVTNKLSVQTKMTL